MRPVVYDPGSFGLYGGPANDGFAGTGTNKSVSTAATWTRAFSSSTLLDVRGGVNYYHNVALAEAAGLKTSTDVGIPGANLDDYTSGLSRFRSADIPIRHWGSRRACRGIAPRRHGTSPRR